MRINARKTNGIINCFCRNDNHTASIPRIVLDDNDIERVNKTPMLIRLYLRLGSVFYYLPNQALWYQTM